jgi:hypothetical protein
MSKVPDPIEYAVLRKIDPRSPRTLVVVEDLARQFYEYLVCAEIQEGIASVHRHGASSFKVQTIVRPGAEALGFVSERAGLFINYPVSALRPDYYLALQDSGIILEVERGKTTINNMDILDFWKCHICEQADYLFLLVPQVRVTENGRTIMRPFKQVQSRLSTFFVPRNYVNVEAVFLFGY